MTSQNEMPAYAGHVRTPGALTLVCKTLVILSTCAPGTVRLVMDVQAWLASELAKSDARASEERRNLSIMTSTKGQLELARVSSANPMMRLLS